VPILALTAAAMATDHEACTNAGMDGVITKPVTLEALTAALAQV
jgi:CheY-like chemotaxis protein